MFVELIKHAIATPTFVTHGVRKIVQGVVWSEPTLPPALDILKDLGYKPVKLTRLMNIYHNKEEVEKARAKLKQREGEEHSSVSILTRNMEKTHPQTQGWCIQNIVLSETYRRKERIVTADIFYRSTELIMKFGADVSLIKTIFDELGVAPSPVRFYFSNAYVSAVFFPLLFQHTDPVKLLDHIRKHDKQFFWLAAKAVSRYLDPVNRYAYRAQVKQWTTMQAMDDRRPLDEFLLKHFGEYHKPHLPKTRVRRVIK